MSEANSNWLEAELRERLGSVEAPRGLWSRIQSPPPIRRPRSLASNRLVWVAGAFFLVAASVDLIWNVSKAGGGLGHMTQPDAADIASIADAPERCDLYSDDPARIRQWVKSRSNIDIELPPHSAKVRIVGAKVVELRGTLVASIAYESGERTGTMLVWKNGRGNSQTSKHVFNGSADRSELVSWTRGENTFTIASAGGSSPKEACLLCHPEGGHGI